MQFLNDDLFRETIQTHPDLYGKSISLNPPVKSRLSVGRMALMVQGEKPGFYFSHFKTHFSVIHYLI